MSYQTGTALHVDDMLDKLGVVAVANGWTKDKQVAGNGNGASGELYLHKGASYFQFEPYYVSGLQYYHSIYQYWDQPALKMYCSLGYDGGEDIDAQPGSTGFDGLSTASVPR